MEFEDKDQDPEHPLRTRFVTTIIDKDHYRMEAICIVPNLKPFTVSRINYTRHRP